MDRTTKPALKLNRETVRALTVNEMTNVAGGAAFMLAPVNCITKTCPVTMFNCFPAKFQA